MVRRKNPFVSKKIISELLDDFALFGSTPFYIVVAVVAFFAGNMVFFNRMAYLFLISFIAILTIKHFHFKDRPQKEEFSIFMEKVVASSFPSTHSLVVTIVALMLSITFPYLWVYVFSAIICLIVYIQRYVTKKHFVVDVVGGIMLAFAEVILVVKLF